MSLLKELKESFDKFGERSGDLLQEGLLDLFNKTQQRLNDACCKGGECDPLANNDKRDEAHGAFMEAADFFFRNGYMAAADSLLIEWWNKLGDRQFLEEQRVYRAKISFKLAELYLRRNDRGAAFWWALHTQADDMLGEHPEGGGSGKLQLRTILGMSEEALVGFNKIATRNVSSLKDSTVTWAQPLGFAEDVVLQFALENPKFASLLAQDTSVLEFPLSSAYFKALLAVVNASYSNKETTAKGKSLERLAAYLFLLMPGWIPHLNIEDEDQAFESDIVVHNFMQPSNLAAEVLGRDFLVECKNWKNSVGVSSVGYFLHRMHLTHAKFGIIFALHETSGGSAPKELNNERAALKLRYKSFHEDGSICIVVSESDLADLADGKVTFWQLLFNKIEQVRFGVQKGPKIEPARTAQETL